MQSPNQNQTGDNMNKLNTQSPGIQKTGIEEDDKNWRFDPKAGDQSSGAGEDSELSADSDEDEDFSNAGTASDESTDEDVTGNPDIGANQNQRDTSNRTSSIR